MSVTKVMTKNVVSVDMDDRLHRVRELFIQKKFHHLLVVNKNNELVAVISERDYFKATTPKVDLPSASSQDLATLNKRVHQIVTRKLVSINQKDSFKLAIMAFQENKVSCLPVVNEKKHPVGIITWRDVINWLYSRVV